MHHWQIWTGEPQQEGSGTLGNALGVEQKITNISAFTRISEALSVVPTEISTTKLGFSFPLQE